MQDSTALLSQLARKADHRPHEFATPHQHEARRLLLLALHSPGNPGAVSEWRLETEPLAGEPDLDPFAFEEEGAVQ